MTTKSKYKILGGFGLLLALNAVVGNLTWLVFIKLKTNPFFIENWQDRPTRISMLFVLGLQGIFLLLLMTQCKFIILNSGGLKLINPLFPFIRKTRDWSDYDYYQTVQEYSRGGFYEAIWLIKDNQLKDRISSFYYTNYTELKAGIKTMNMGKLEMNPFRQLFCLFGLKIKN
jgi:hypothetical protein